MIAALNLFFEIALSIGWMVLLATMIVVFHDMLKRKEAERRPHKSSDIFWRCNRCYSVMAPWDPQTCNCPHGLPSPLEQITRREYLNTKVEQQDDLATATREKGKSVPRRFADLGDVDTRTNREKIKSYTENPHLDLDYLAKLQANETQGEWFRRDQEARMDPNCLEGAGPSPADRAAMNAQELGKLTTQARFALMFGKRPEELTDQQIHGVDVHTEPEQSLE